MMKRTANLLFCLMLIGGCQGNTEPASTSSDKITTVTETPEAKDGRVRCMAVWPDSEKEKKDKAFREHAANVQAALGSFDDIGVFKWDDAKQAWTIIAGQYVPVTVNNETPSGYFHEMRSDRPMMLPTRVQGFQGGDGQSSPYSVMGRMTGTNPEVEWVWVVRQYSIKKPSDADFNEAGDIAIIGHHPRTGATAFFQYYEPSKPKPATVVYSPFSPEATDFWSPIDKLAAEFRCERCHASDAFIHTPWVNQVRVQNTGPNAPYSEAMVPSSPLGPYFFIDSGPGERFECWNYALDHLDVPDNQCTGCHRITPYDLAGLGENSTRYAGLEFEDRNQFSLTADMYQSDTYYDHTWMPALDLTNFYSGQSTPGKAWNDQNEESASTVNHLTLKGLPVVSQDCYAGMPDSKPCLPPVNDPNLKRIPRPPEQYETILVDRPNQDVINENSSLWIVDTRMRANTDGDLENWQFVAKQGSDTLTAAPVVYRRIPGDGSQLEFEVVFVGEARNGTSAQTWTPFSKNAATVPVKQGDYFGLALNNGGSESAKGLVPYTDDDWAELRWPDGSVRKADGYVVYSVSPETSPAAGDKVMFKDANYRTYSFELQNKLP